VDEEAMADSSFGRVVVGGVVVIAMFVFYFGDGNGQGDE
jgi:hypothetical protein